MQKFTFSPYASPAGSFEGPGIYAGNIPGRKATKILSLALLLASFLSQAVTSLGQNVGDYRSAQSGNWNNHATWERWNGSAWVTPTAAFTANASSQNNAAETSHVIALPTGISAGDLLIIFWADQNTASNLTFPGWTQIYERSAGDRRHSAYYRIADGSEGASATFTTDNGERSAHNAYRIPAGTFAGIPVAGTPVEANSNSPNPPSLTSGFGNTNTLWIAASHSAGEDMDAYPANYNFQVFSNTGGMGSAHATMATASLELVAASEDPGPFTLGGNRIWSANTVAIQIAPSDGVPGSTSGAITIRNGHTVTVTEPTTIDQCTIETGGQVTVNSGQTLTVNDGTGTDLTVDGTLSNAGIITANGSLAFGSGGTYIHNRNGGTAPTATWDANSSCEITGVTSTIPAGLGQSFGHFTYNCPGQTGNESLPSMDMSVAGLLRVVSTGGGRLQMMQSPLTAGSLSLEGGTFRIAGGGARTLTVAGNVAIVGGTLNMSTGNIGTLNIGGDFSHTGGTITETGGGSGSIIFNGATKNCTGGGAISNNINFTINNGSTLTGTGPIGSTNGTTVNNGAISPGNSIGNFTINGPFTNNGTIEIEITGTSGDNDVLAVNGDATLGGTVNVALLSGTVDQNDSYDIITWVSYSGSFTTINLPGIPADWAPSPTYNANNLNITYSSASPLPIELTSFTGRALEKAIILKWATASELDNDYMAVERSADGIKFEEIGRVKGSGTTQEPQQYSLTDERPLYGINYYRLRQVDFDGAFEYHKIISVAFNGKGANMSVSVFPNPANEMLHATWAASTEQPATLRVLDMAGRQLALHTAPAGASSFELPLNNLPAGLYFLQVRQGSDVEVVRFRRD